MAKILLVEDDNNLREIYGERLMAEGYDIVSASDGEEALQTAVTEKPDLIISDVMMPKISGFDMLDILRQTPETKNVRIIMMTALSQAEDKTRADKLGADKYLVKSQVTLEDVARVVHDLLGDGEPSSPEETIPETPDITPTISVAPVVTAPEPVALPAAPVVAEPVVATPPAPEPVVVPSVAAPEPVAPVVAPVVTAPEPVALPAAPVVAEPVVATPPAPEPVVVPSVAAPEPVAPVETVMPFVNPITGVGDATTIDGAEEELQATQAQDSQAELNEVAQQIEQFVAATGPEVDHQAPMQEPTQQDIIHAQNAAEEPTIVSAQPATTVAATIPPVAPLNTGNPEPASSRKKIIQPVNGEGLSTPDIHALYEQEMAKEAAFSPIANPESGEVVESAAEDTSPQNPIASASTEPAAPPPLETIDVSQITGMYGSEDEAEAAAILQQAASIQSAPVSTETPVITTAQSGIPTAPEPNTDPSNPNNIAL